MPRVAHFVAFDCTNCGVEVTHPGAVKGSKPHLGLGLCGPCKSRASYAKRLGKTLAEYEAERQVELTCAVCGVSWLHTRSAGRIPGRCPECMPKSRPESSIGQSLECRMCSTTFVKKHGNQKFCSGDCYEAAESRKERERRRNRGRLVECSWCGSRVLRDKPSKSGRYFCSSLCQWGYKRCVLDGVTSVSWPKSQPCIECGEQYQTRSKSAKRCPDCRAAHVETLKVDQACQDCGEIVRAQPGLKRCRDCKKRHDGRKKSRRNNNRHLRRRAYIVERDGGRCQVCHCRVVWGNPIHPRAGEIDHIIPRSLWPVGEPGKNDPSNLRLLCRTCNAQKSNGTAPGGDQLLLVG